VGRRFGAKNLKRRWAQLRSEREEAVAVEEERELIERLVRGDETALEALILLHRDLGTQIASKFGVSEDMVMPHLVMALALYNPRMGRIFRSFARDYITSMVRHELR
jgi:DNA-directed RNA polymerase specialized sigma subunit